MKDIEQEEPTGPQGEWAKYPRLVQGRPVRRLGYYVTVFLWLAWSCVELAFVGPPKSPYQVLYLGIATFFVSRFVIGGLLLFRSAPATNLARAHCWLGIGLFVLYLPFLCVAAYGALFATLMGVQMVLGLTFDSCVSGLLLFQLRDSSPASSH